MIILLNAPSSAGKTTLSRELVKIWPRPLYYLSYDTVDWHMAPFGTAGRDFPDPERPGETLDPVRDFLSVMYLCAAAVDRSGRDVVVDNCLFDTEDIHSLSAEIMKGCRTFFVRIDVSDETLAAREKARGDRTPGKALWQKRHRIPREDEAYDLILDGEQPAARSAQIILEKVCPPEQHPRHDA